MCGLINLTTSSLASLALSTTILILLCLSVQPLHSTSRMEISWNMGYLVHAGIILNHTCRHDNKQLPDNTHCARQADCYGHPIPTLEDFLTRRPDHGNTSSLLGTHHRLFGLEPSPLAALQQLTSAFQGSWAHCGIVGITKGEG